MLFQFSDTTRHVKEGDGLTTEPVDLNILVPCTYVELERGDAASCWNIITDRPEGWEREAKANKPRERGKARERERERERERYTHARTKRKRKRKRDTKEEEEEGEKKGEGGAGISSNRKFRTYLHIGTFTSDQSMVCLFGAIALDLLAGEEVCCELPNWIRRVKRIDSSLKIDVGVCGRTQRQGGGYRAG